MKNRFSWPMIGLIVFIIGFAITMCTWPEWIIPDPDPLPVQIDTVCTTYTPIENPAFVSTYMIGDGASTTGQRVLVVWELSDTLEAGEDVGASLKNLLETKYPQYSHTVWVRPGDDRYIFSITKGTNDRNILFGKMYIRYNGARYQFGVQKQLMMPVASSHEEFMDMLTQYPSFNYINWYGSSSDSLQSVKEVDTAIDTAHCKGGREWMDFRHNPFGVLQRQIDDANDAGWGFVGTD